MCCVCVCCLYVINRYTQATLTLLSSLRALSLSLPQVGLDREQYEWYTDLRKYGTCVHSGFGLGFERLILFTTGMENIRDVIPFPRWPGNARG